MTRKKAKSADQTSFGTPGTMETPGALRSPPVASGEPRRLLASTPFQSSSGECRLTRLSEIPASKHNEARLDGRDRHVRRLSHRKILEPRPSCRVDWAHCFFQPLWRQHWEHPHETRPNRGGLWAVRTFPFEFRSPRRTGADHGGFREDRRDQRHVRNSVGPACRREGTKRRREVLRAGDGG